MPVKKYSVEQIIAKAARDREAHRAGDVGTHGGRQGRCHRLDLLSVADSVRRVKEEEAKRLQLLELENARLKRIVAD